MKKAIMLVAIMFMSVFISLTMLLNIGTAKEKIILVTGEWPPYTSGKMEGYGFFTEIVSAVFKEAGFEVEYQFYPWLRCEKNIQNGNAYATFPYIINDERKAIYDFSDPFANSTGKFFYLKSNIKSDIVWEKYEDLKKYKIGGTAGYWYVKAFEEVGMKIDLAASDEIGMKKLYGGRFDLLATEELVGWSLIKTLFPAQLDNFGMVKKPLNTDELRLMVSRTYPEAASFTPSKSNCSILSIIGLRSDSLIWCFSSSKNG
ncbi:MAG: transporter substrate-binding domain-containing protein [Desulfamplus sp.]|nr:transporter substrate-binding domain-containing protein [Desulfamplus sp.]